jgi:hypothetical protein
MYISVIIRTHRTDGEVAMDRMFLTPTKLKLREDSRQAADKAFANLLREPKVCLKDFCSCAVVS